MPGLPERWDSKLVLPFIDRSYSFGDLVYRGDMLSNPIFPDSSGDLYFTTSDSTPAPLTIDPIACWQVPGAMARKDLELRRHLKWRPDSSVVPFKTTLALPLAQVHNKIIKGSLASNTPPGYNRIMLKVALSDSFANPLLVRITAENIKGGLTGTPRIDSILCGGNIRSDSIFIAIAGDSVYNPQGGFIDSVRFSCEVLVDGRLSQPPSRLHQSLTISLELLPLEFSSLRGVVIAQGYVPGVALINPPLGAEGLQFDSATVLVAITADPTVFEDALCRFAGRKSSRTIAQYDTLLNLPVSGVLVPMAAALNGLPDSLLFYVQAFSTVDDYRPGNLPATGISVEYTLNLPLSIHIPSGTVELMAGKSSTYVIKDSTTRSKVLNSQNGVIFDCDVENFSPLTGRVTILVSNYDLFPQDTVNRQLPPDYLVIGGQIFHVDTDTVLVRSDTLLSIDLPAAGIEAGRVTTPGRGQQAYQAAGQTVSYFAATCYLRPYFRLKNEHNERVILNREHYIRIKSYLNLLLTADTLKE